jgi:membrane associated rhomboid family serine protease
MTQGQAPEQGTVPAEESVPLSAELVTGSPTEYLSEQQARLCALVLDARAIPCHLENDGESWSLLVPSGYLVSAVHEVRLFVEENSNWPPPLPPTHPLTENTLATLSILLLLATFHNITRLDLPLPGSSSPDWIALGNANTALIRDGQWWRLVTALTLHANVLHLFSNLAIGGIFIICLCRELGSGLAWSLILGSGVLGNLLNSLAQSPDHRSVGASTAVFGTVGILAAVSMVRSRSHFKKRWLLLPTAASLALLAILGTEGEHTDIGAHLFGFLSGMGLGLGAESLVRKNGRPGARLNALLAVVGILVVIWAWSVAFNCSRKTDIVARSDVVSLRRQPDSRPSNDSPFGRHGAVQRGGDPT